MACLVFFFNDTATTEIYTLSLHDALPISAARRALPQEPFVAALVQLRLDLLHRLQAHSHHDQHRGPRSEEHTSELQSRQYLVCRLLLEKKNKTLITILASTPVPRY